MKISGEIVDLTKVVGKRYATFWNYKGRYRIVKGGRGSKKSYTTALWFISNMMKLKDSNLLVVRKVFDTHRGSTFAQLKTAMKRLKVSHLWKCMSEDLEQKILELDRIERLERLEIDKKKATTEQSGAEKKLDQYINTLMEALDEE